MPLYEITYPSNRKYTKLISGLKDLTCEACVKALNLPTLAYQRLRGDAIEMFKILSGKYDQDVSNFIEMSSQQITRGKHLKIKDTKTHIQPKKILISQQNN